MAQEPLVSVVMPCLDAGRMLRRALTSVIRPTYARLEIVFFGNGSTGGHRHLAPKIGGASGGEFRFAALVGYRFLHVPGAQVYYNVGARAQQISAVTPYTVRVVSLRDIYARLGAVADRPGVKPRITSRHRALLKQDWDLWRLPPDSV